MVSITLKLQNFRGISGSYVVWSIEMSLTRPWMLYWVHFTWVGLEVIILAVIGTDCIGSYKSNYHTITTRNSFGTHWIDFLLYITLYTVIKKNENKNLLYLQIFGFLNMLVWAGNLWFLYKETPYFSCSDVSSW
jgi:hypothetical protein